MKTTVQIKHLGLVYVALSLVACGGSLESPLAQKMISVPVGANKALDFKPESVSTTLLEQVVHNGVPREIATVAFSKYDQFRGRVTKVDWMAAIDFTKDSGQRRFYMIDTNTGEVDPILVAHGSGSDPGNTGTPRRFSNIPNSKMSSLGAYIINEKYYSPKHGTTARLDGLESSNSFARPRDLIMHSAFYVAEGRSKMGMSWGCPALAMDKIATALSRLSGGSFMYAYGFQGPSSRLDEENLRQLLLNPAFKWLDEGEDAPFEGE